MRKIEILVGGHELGQKQAQELSRILAEEENSESVCLARYNRRANACSPCCLQGRLGDKPGWEVYGETHGGRLKVTVNNGDYIFIFS